MITFTTNTTYRIMVRITMGTDSYEFADYKNSTGPIQTWRNGKAHNNPQTQIPRNWVIA